MKVLLFDSSGFHEHNNVLCCEFNTGCFAKELYDLGNEVILYGQTIGKGDSVHTFDLVKNGLKVVSYERKNNKFLNYIYLYYKLIPWIKKSDFVYIYYPNSFKYATILCKIFHKKYGIYIRGMKGVENKFSRWIYKNAFTIFTVSNYFTDFVNRVVGREIANTIRPMIPYTNNDIEYGRVYDLKKKSFNILFLARVSSDKGVNELLEAAKILHVKGYSFHITFVGDGEYMEETLSLIDKLDIRNIIDVRGAVYDNNLKRKCFLDSDIYVLPTYHEGFPRTLYEAMIFGTPIVTTFVGGIPSLMKDGYNCKGMEPRSVQSLIENLEFAMENYSSMVEYAKEGFNTIERIVDSKRLTHAEHLNTILRNERK